MKKLFPIFLLLAACQPARNLQYYPVVGNLTGDTVRETILVTGRTPSFAHSIQGYAIRRNDSCIAHLDDQRRPIKLPVKVWSCDHKSIKIYQ